MSDTQSTAAPSGPAQEIFVEGEGFKPSTSAPVVISEGRATRVLPAALLAKIEGKAPEATLPAEAQKTEEKPAETAPAATIETPAPDPAKPAEPVKTEAPAAEANTREATLAAANAKLLAELEEVRKAPAPARHKLDEAVELYLDDDYGALRRFVARSLDIEDPEHADVTAELQSLYEGLTSKLLNVPLDPAQQALRNAAKVRQALARDKKSRKADGDGQAKGETAKAEASKAQEHVSFIGNRLSLARTGTDGKPAPSYRDQYAVGASLAPQFNGGKTFEETILESIPHLTRLGILDPARANDDDYLVSETAKYLDTQFSARYQALADAFGKARPPSPPSTATQTPAPTPAADTSAGKAPPQGHGGRTLTKADESAVPATLPSPAPTPSKKPKSRAEFLRERFGD